MAVFAADGGCSSAGNACSTTCQTDLDCNKLGPNYKCFASCGTTKYCGATL
jgi:hypothetical protein